MAEEAKFFPGAIRRIRHWAVSKLSDHYCIRGGTHTILISPYVAEYFEKRLAGIQHVIPNPIADEFFNIERHDDGNRVIFAGRLRALKGINDLITAVGHIAPSQDVELVLAGSVREHAYVDQLKNQAIRLGIAEKVHFLGLLSVEQLRDELSRSAVLVLPSYQETAPMVIVEAMAAGIPVIATNVGGVSYDVIDGVTGYLIEPADVLALADRLRKLLSDAELRRSFGDAGKRSVIEKNRALRVAERTIEVYRQVRARQEMRQYP
jgi:glycosyltransferase involved in cell wall biosynthesis